MNHFFHRLLTHIMSHALVDNHIDNLLSHNLRTKKKKKHHYDSL